MGGIDLVSGDQDVDELIKAGQYLRFGRISFKTDG